MNSVDCGLFNMTYFDYIKSEVKKDEKVSPMPKDATIANNNRDADYTYVNESGGKIRPGTRLTKDTVVVSKYAPAPPSMKPVGAPKTTLVDRSTVYKDESEGVVERVEESHMGSEGRVIKVKYRSNYIVGVGDKLCLDDQHEVLTCDGWLPVTELTLSHQIACLMGDDLAYLAPSALYCYEHDGEMLLVESDEVDQCVTLDHKMYVAINADYAQQCNTDACAHDCAAGSDTEFALVPARELVGKDTKYKKNANWYGCVQNMGACNSLPKNVWSLGQRGAQEMLDEVLRVCPVKSSEGANMYCVKSKQFADDLSRLALHAGFAANVTQDASSYLVQITRNTTPYVHNSQCKVVHYTGRVYCVEVPGHVFYTRRNGKPSWTGNSSRTGNKGIIGNLMSRSDMPRCSDGLTPDILVNAHSIPSRMAVNQILECLMGQIGAMSGKFMDATSFSDLNTDELIAEFERLGGKYHGHRRMYNRHGEALDTMVFIGPTRYQQLQKLVQREKRANASGPSSNLTKQPTEGKLGGLRLGEMEVSVMMSHGSMIYTRHKLHNDSDGTIIYVCRRCSKRATVNADKRERYSCVRCKSQADIVAVDSTFSSNLLLNECDAMNVGTRLHIQPHQFPVE
jgi:hypothetical protein